MMEELILGLVEAGPFRVRERCVRLAEFNDGMIRCPPVLFRVLPGQVWVRKLEGLGWFGFGDVRAALEYGLDPCLGTAPRNWRGLPFGREFVG